MSPGQTLPLLSSLLLLATTASSAELDDPSYREAYAHYEQAVAAGNFDAAHRHARKCLELASQQLGPTHAETGILAFNLGAVDIELRRFGDAIKVLSRALSIYEVTHGEDALENLAPLLKLAEAHEALEHWLEAERHYVRAVQIIELQRGRNDDQIGEILLRLGIVANSLSKPKRVRSYGLRAVHIFEATRGEHDLRLALLHIGLARNELGVNDAREARKHLKSADVILAKQAGSGDRQLPAIYDMMADVYASIGKPAKARKYRKQAEAARQADDARKQSSLEP